MKKTRCVKNGMMLWTDSYLADTGHLTCLEHGAYLLILMAMWRSPTGWIANDRVMLSRTARLTLDKWRRVESTICPLLIQSEDKTKVSQTRLLHERQIAQSKSEKRSVAAKGCRAPKPLKNNDVGSDFAGVLFEPPNPNPNPKKVRQTEGEVIPWGEGGAGGGAIPDLASAKSKPVKPQSKIRAGRAGQTYRLPVDFKLEPASIQYANDRGFEGSAADELFHAFKDHHVSRGNRMVDWVAAWRNWVRNEVKFGPKRGRNGTSQLPAGNAYARIALRMAKELAEEKGQ